MSDILESIFIFDYRLSDKRVPIQIAAGINGSCKTNICGVLLPKHADSLILPPFNSLQYEIMNKKAYRNA
jgi:hypothetical protein